MKDYKRLTERGEPYYGFEKCKTCEYGKDSCDKWCDQIIGCFCRLQELEDKIESGELCDRKETAEKILKPLYNVIMEHPDCCVNLSEDIKFLMEKYGIDLQDEE